MHDDVGIDIGRTVLELADEAIDFGAELGASADRLDGGTTVVDLGVEAGGTLDAGLLLASLRRGGLLAAEIGVGEAAGHVWPLLEATTGHPGATTRVADTIEVDRWTLSGPGVNGHTEPFAVVVAVGDDPIDAEGAGAIADAAGVAGEDLYVVATAPGSTSWGVDAAASGIDAATRGVEAAAEVTVSEALIESPLPPATDTPDSTVDVYLRHGGRAHLRVRGSVDDSIAPPLAEVLSDGPAVVTVVDDHGTVVTVGERDEGRLEAALEG